jgi:hypothetical protein
MNYVFRKVVPSVQQAHVSISLNSYLHEQAREGIFLPVEEAIDSAILSILERQIYQILKQRPCSINNS